MLRYTRLCLCLLLFCFNNDLHSQFTLQDSLQLHYPFSGNANDASGNGINGSVIGASLATDRFGNANSAYHFDGNNDYILTNTPFDYPVRTASFWFRTLDSTGSYHMMISQNANTLTYGAMFAAFGSGDLTVIPGGGSTYNYTGSVDTSDWHHMVLVRTNTSEAYYLDGVLQATGNSGPNANGTFTTANLYLGCGSVEADNDYEGYLDEVRIYNRALSQPEINQLFCASAPWIDLPDTSIYSGTSLTFNNLNTNYDSTAWLLNGNLISNDSFVSHTFTISGQYQIILFSQDSNCNGFDTVNIQVYPPPNCLEANSTQKISNTQGNFNGDLDGSDLFGRSIETIGDANGDGILDLAVSSINDDDGGSNRGAIYILYMNPDGSVSSHHKISSDSGGFGSGLANNDKLGTGITNIGDLNGDGYIDLAVGAGLTDDGGSNRGAVWILFLDSNEEVSSKQKISDTQGGLTYALSNDDRFGLSVASIGDLNSDGIPDLLVGAQLDDVSGTDDGTVIVLFMNSNGTVQSEQASIIRLGISLSPLLRAINLEVPYRGSVILTMTVSLK